MGEGHNGPLVLNWVKDPIQMLKRVPKDAIVFECCSRHDPWDISPTCLNNILDPQDTLFK